jgi:hypothetical protein
VEKINLKKSFKNLRKKIKRINNKIELIKNYLSREVIDKIKMKIE